MSRSHSEIYNRFADFLVARNAEPDDGRDIRDHVLSLRRQQVGIGYHPAALSGGYGSNLPRLFPKIVPFGAPEWDQCKALLLPGTIDPTPERSHNVGTKMIGQWAGNQELILCEQGFLASSHSWSHAFREKDPGYACLGYVFDDIAHYFMADYPNRLNRKLNGTDAPTPAELERARALIDRIAARRISKYNAQPMAAPIEADGRSRVLVCDQAFADASTIYGRIDTSGFETMLIDAIRENPDAEILVKTHPDTAWQKGTRRGYFSKLTSHGRVRTLRDPVNPFALFDLVDRVYVGTSQMGLEALFAGKNVTCYGAPFYAGWGLTDDRTEVPHRRRTRTLEELFHYAYLWYTIYHVPGDTVPSTIETALDYIDAFRPVSLPVKPQRERTAPTVSVLMPVYNAATTVEASIASIQRQSLAEIEIIPVLDAPTDESLTVVERLAQDDPRIKPVVLAENVGQGNARNQGIEQASGEFIFFLDADDWIARTDTLARAVDAARTAGAEIVRLQKLGFEDGAPPYSAALDPVEKGFLRDRVVDDPSSDLAFLASWHVWQNLYRRDLIGRAGIRFHAARWEERPFFLAACKAANRAACIAYPGVLYRRRQGSTTLSRRVDGDLDMFLTGIAQAVTEVPPGNPRTLVALQFASLLAANGGWREVVAQRLKSTGLATLRKAFVALEDVLEPPRFAIPSVAGGRTVWSRGWLFLAGVQAGDEWSCEVALGEAPVDLADLHGKLRTLPPALVPALTAYAQNERVKLQAPLAHKPMTKGVVWLHLGMTKTGTTYLQDTWDAARGPLLQNGVWYPETGIYRAPAGLPKQGGHAGWVAAARRNDPVLRSMLDTALASDTTTSVVLSSEAFFLDPDALKLPAYLDGYDVRGLVYLRDHLSWAKAQYAECAAGGAVVERTSLGFEDWLGSANTDRRLRYRDWLDAWRKALGPDRLVIRPYRKEAWTDGRLAADVAAVTGLEPLDVEPDQIRTANVRALGTAEIAAVAAYGRNRFLDDRHYLEFIEEATRRLVETRQDTQASEFAVPDAAASVLRRAWDADFEALGDLLPPLEAALPDTRAEDAKPIEETVACAYADVLTLQDHRANALVRSESVTGWRRSMFPPMLRPFVRKLGSSTDLERFDRDPVGFFHSLSDPRYRAVTSALFPASPLPAEWRVSDVLGWDNDS